VVQFENCTSTHYSENLSVFLCHSSKDKAAVRKLFERLHGDGFRVWFDEVSLPPAQEWESDTPRKAGGLMGWTASKME
jgi:hypothetical protein